MGSHANKFEDHYCVFSTELGWFAVGWSVKGIRRVTIGHASARAAERIVSQHAGRASVADPPQQLAERLKHFAAGNVDCFRDIDLDDPPMTEFQRRVLESCREIPYGETLSYAQLAAIAGSPRAARAVGNVMANNHFPVLIPCHRVVGSNHSLGGFSAPSGISLKQRMLANEAGQLATPSR
jgi:methylated-DNA-[protein]-cysteine S-methyltransferase